jgi:hypothetical protein
MRSALFGLAWAFVFVAAAYDCYFAWQYREVLPVWEENPLACWAVGRLGLEAVFLLKFAGLAFAAGLAVYCRRRRPGLGRAMTLVVAAAYALLSLHYLLGQMQPDAYRVATLATTAPASPDRLGLRGR